MAYGLDGYSRADLENIVVARCFVLGYVIAKMAPESDVPAIVVGAEDALGLPEAFRVQWFDGEVPTWE